LNEPRTVRKQPSQAACSPAKIASASRIYFFFIHPFAVLYYVLHVFFAGLQFPKYRYRMFDLHKKFPTRFTVLNMIAMTPGLQIMSLMEILW
jgi:hypothetical protein